MKQLNTEQLLVQKAFHNPTSRVYNAKTSRRGFGSSVWCVRARARQREGEKERGRGVGVSVKMISGFSVRMNFTTVSSHEII